MPPTLLDQTASPIPPSASPAYTRCRASSSAQPYSMPQGAAAAALLAPGAALAEAEAVVAGAAVPEVEAPPAALRLCALLSSSTVEHPISRSSDRHVPSDEVVIAVMGPSHGAICVGEWWKYERRRS